VLHAIFDSEVQGIVSARLSEKYTPDGALRSPAITIPPPSLPTLGGGSTSLGMGASHGGKRAREVGTVGKEGGRVGRSAEISQVLGADSDDEGASGALKNGKGAAGAFVAAKETDDEEEEEEEENFGESDENEFKDLSLDGNGLCSDDDSEEVQKVDSYLICCFIEYCKQYYYYYYYFQILPICRRASVRWTLIELSRLDSTDFKEKKLVDSEGTSLLDRPPTVTIKHNLSQQAKRPRFPPGSGLRLDEQFCGKRFGGQGKSATLAKRARPQAGKLIRPSPNLPPGQAAKAQNRKARKQVSKDKKLKNKKRQETTKRRNERTAWSAGWQA